MRYEIEINLNQTIMGLRNESEEKFDDSTILEALIRNKLGIFNIKLENVRGIQTNLCIESGGYITLYLIENDIISDVLSDTSNIKVLGINNYKSEKAGVFKEFIESKINKSYETNILKMLEEK